MSKASYFKGHTIEYDVSGPQLIIDGHEKPVRQADGWFQLMMTNFKREIALSTCEVGFIIKPDLRNAEGRGNQETIGTTRVPTVTVRRSREIRHEGVNITRLGNCIFPAGAL